MRRRISRRSPLRVGSPRARASFARGRMLERGPRGRYRRGWPENDAHRLRAAPLRGDRHRGPPRGAPRRRHRAPRRRGGGAPVHAARRRRPPRRRPEDRLQGGGPNRPARRRHALARRPGHGDRARPRPAPRGGHPPRIVRMDQGVLITETHHGWVCANAGVDQSNVDVECVALLPEDPDGSALALRDRIRALAGVDVFVIVADTFGRPWREGLTNVAIGLAGLSPLRSYLGERDPAGRPLQATILAVADELAAAAEPVMGKLDRIPAAIVRGAPLTPSEEGSKPLLRDPARDLFR